MPPCLGAAAGPDLVGGSCLGLRLNRRLGLTRSLLRTLGCRPHEFPEQRLGSVRPRLELWVELGGDEEWMVGQFDHLDETLVR